MKLQVMEAPALFFVLLAYLVSVDSKFCPNDKHECYETMTCCLLIDDHYGCCPYTEAHCCKDRIHCCPKDSECDDEHRSCKAKNKSFLWKVRVYGAEDTLAAFPMQSTNEIKKMNKAVQSCASPEHNPCKQSETCCETVSTIYGVCCPYTNGICCEKGKFCCPKGYSCNSKGQNCLMEDENGSVLFVHPFGKTKRRRNINIIPFSKSSTSNITLNNTSVICPDRSRCPDRTTCCIMNDGQYGCCPYQQGVCCSDKLHCCPHGTVCSGTLCIPTSMNLGERQPLKLP